MHVITPTDPHSRSPAYNAAAGPILVAVANNRRRHLVSQAVQTAAPEVIAVRRGNELLEYLADVYLGVHRRSAPALIVSESTLPGCPGLELLTGLRDLRWELPVILLTRRNEVHIRNLAWELGAVGLFIAPYNLTELRSLASLVVDPVVAREIRNGRARAAIPPANPVAGQPDPAPSLRSSP